ncbi:MAG: HAD family hydrolase [Ornithinimicrobium sp.]
MSTGGRPASEPDRGDHRMEPDLVDHRMNAGQQSVDHRGAASTAARAMFTGRTSNGPAVTRVAVWSGPRNISTAMMRSWENRDDTDVVDEPFYAAYLDRTGLDHPARGEIIASQPARFAQVVKRLQTMPGGRADGGGVAYAKQMSHHMLAEDDLSWTHDFANVLLIRDPIEVVASYVKSRESCEPDDIGIPQQAQLWAQWQDAGLDVPVIEAADFLRDPEAHLRWVCDWLGIEFSAAMLSWPAGPRASDGVWAPHWYDAVNASTGFAPWTPRGVDLNDHDAAVAEQCRAVYEMLWEYRVRL